MGKKKQTDEVPQWVRDFITQKWEQEPEEKEEQASHDTYLLNPFSQDEVEAIRKGVWKLIEEAALAKAREYRRLREAGANAPPPDFPLHDDFFESYFHELLHTPLTRQEMQQAVVKHYGWEKWSEDPWGDFSKFCKWINSIGDDERGVCGLPP